MCLSGPSGSGKSLLLRMVADLIPHDGTMTLDGRACADMPAPERRRRIGYVSAETAWWAPTVRAHMRDDAEPAFDALGLPRRLLDQLPDLASTGERQRMALVRAVLRKPKVLLLDEPTSALDPDTTLLVEAFLRELCNAGTAILVVSHDPAQRDRLGARQIGIGE